MEEKLVVCFSPGDEVWFLLNYLPGAPAIIAENRFTAILRNVSYDIKATQTSSVHFRVES